MRAHVRGRWSFPSKQPFLPVLKIHGTGKWQPVSCRHAGQEQKHSLDFYTQFCILGAVVIFLL